MKSTTTNIASHLPAMAALDPERPAIIEPLGRKDGAATWRTISFAELDALSSTYASGLAKIGIGRGVRTVLMAPPSLDFFALVFGLFKVGAVLVMIDPGIGRRSLLSCLDEVRPEAFVGIPRAHIARWLFPRPFRHVRATVTIGGGFAFGGHSLERVRHLGERDPMPAIVPNAGETAAILFTSGSTGIPKGAVYSHEIFDAQVRAIRAMYRIQPGEIDLPTFPLFALFDPALGMTAVLPEMDFRFPAKASPQRLIEAIETHRCTNMFGSPALLDALSRYGVAKGVRLPTLKRVLSAGAPVRVDVLDRMTKLLAPTAEVFTPFGATESLPVASIGSSEVLAETGKRTQDGAGVCVGLPAPGMHVRVIEITDDAIDEWSAVKELGPGSIGELTVKGDVVTREYDARPEQTRLAKIRDGAHVVHRMGDVGWIDELGRVWMCGRKSHRVETRDGRLFTVPVEEILNRHPDVHRTALVGVGARGSEIPVVLIEKEATSAMTDEALVATVRALAARHEKTKAVAHFAVYPSSFPVDARHNAKIEREKLREWAAKHVVRSAS